MAVSRYLVFLLQQIQWLKLLQQQEEHAPVGVNVDEDDVNQKCMAGLEQILILIQTRKDLHKKEERNGWTNQTVPPKQ